MLSNRKARGAGTFLGPDSTASERGELLNVDEGDRTGTDQLRLLRHQRDKKARDGRRQLSQTASGGFRALPHVDNELATVTQIDGERSEVAWLSGMKRLEGRKLLLVAGKSGAIVPIVRARWRGWQISPSQASASCRRCGVVHRSLHPLCRLRPQDKI